MHHHWHIFSGKLVLRIADYLLPVRLFPNYKVGHFDSYIDLLKIFIEVCLGPCPWSSASGLGRRMIHGEYYKQIDDWQSDFGINRLKVDWVVAD